MTSRATSRPPMPNAIAAANATAPSKIKNVGAVSSTAIPSCVNAANTAYTMMAYLAMLPRRADPVAPLTKLAQDAVGGLLGLGPVEELLYATALHPPIEAYTFQEPSYEGLKGSGYDV